MQDELGTRIKENYENRTRFFLPRRTYTIIRLDGKAFHSFTRQFKRPYDKELMDMMDGTAISLCNQIQGAKFAYVQSDEINILVTDFEGLGTDAWFDGNIQKIVSVSASIATAAFNSYYFGYLQMSESDQKKREIDAAALGANCLKLAHFDSRVFTVSDIKEVENVFIWRQQDATKNAIQMLAQAYFSHKDLQNKNGSQLQDMLMLQKNINFNDEPVGFKRGRLVRKFIREVPERIVNDKVVPAHTRNYWKADEPPIFTQERDYLRSMIPTLN